MKKCLCSLLVSLLLLPAARGQFYVTGSEPAGTRWRELSTGTYRVIYPEGLDSLARVYATQLERFRLPVSGTAGYRPNEQYRKPMPVLLQTRTGDANGMVVWTPRRMELQTNPEASDPEATPWPVQLSVHESRHVAQMQYVRDGLFRTLSYLSGELCSGMATALYGGSAFFEGDAVVAETALTDGGRGRSADFLSYYRISFAQGDWRNYWRWRYGSLNAFSPNHYALGYLLTAGMRTAFDTPDFTARYYRRLFRHKPFLPFFNLQKTVREASGESFAATFRDIQQHFAAEWEENAAARRPYTEGAPVVPTPRLYQRYAALCYASDTLYAIRSGLDRSTELVRMLPDGRFHRMGSFSGAVSRLCYHPETGRVFWTEVLPDRRWEWVSTSVLRYFGPDGKKHTLSAGERLYNPAADPASRRLSVTVYGRPGTSAVRILDARDGTVLKEYPAPSGLQIVESAWLDARLYVSAISDEGFGLYEATDGFRRVLPPVRVKLKQLSGRNGTLLFLSDRDGADNLYSVDPVSGQVLQLTSMEFGAGDYAFCPDGTALLMAEEGHEGRLPVRIPLSGLRRQEVDFSFRYLPPHAEKMSAQEPFRPGEDAPAAIGEPVPYVRWKHLAKIHSWLPFYMHFDDIASISSESLANDGGLGATALFQNELGTAYGALGYGLVYDGARWRHGAHLQAVYRGLYPVIEANVDISNEERRYYHFTYTPGPEGTERSLESQPDGAPGISADLKAYIPFDFTSGGWSRGVIPSLRYAISNNRFTGTRNTVPVHFLQAGVRAYAIGGRGRSCVFPRWGIGGETGVFARPGMAEVSAPDAYLDLYAYLPGLMRTHGLRLEAYVEQALERGGASYTRFDAEYALPFAPVDWSFLCPVAYIRNFEFRLKETVGSRPACTTASLCARLGNFLWVPGDARLGISLTWDSANVPKNTYIGGILQMDL